MIAAIFQGLLFFFMCWWMVIFTILPFGIENKQEQDNVYEDRGAPIRHNMLKKIIITTIITIIIEIIFFTLVHYNIIDLRSIFT